MESVVTLLCLGNPSASELNTLKIVEFMGLNASCLRVPDDVSERGQCLRRSLPAGGCLIASAQTLSTLCDARPDGMKLLRLITGLAGDIFVYGFQPTPSHGLLLSELTSGGYVGVQALPSAGLEFRVDRNSRDLCRQFAGLSFGSADPACNATFAEGPNSALCSSPIRIGGSPFLVCSNKQRGRLFLLGCREVADLDVAAPRDTSAIRFFPGLMPLLMFIGSALRPRCWSSDAPRACFIVDDPLLTKRYGFLDYQELLKRMERGRFCTSIAFVPWNFKRSDAGVVQLFASHPHRYSLCVHGCDHTRGEFGVLDPWQLGERSRQALERMELHRGLSGLPFDDIMVFPQGIFSTAAMTALKSSGFLAAVNSTAFPTDDGHSLTLRDLLEVAVTRFANFPLFTRRSPERLAELACDLFVGKPALVVEHHGFFRDGYEGLSRFVERVNGLDERLEWTNLAAICSQACLKRDAGNGEVHVRFCTDRFTFRNDGGRPQSYVLIRRDQPEDGSVAITIDGCPVDHGRENDSLRIPVRLDAGQAAEVRIQRGQAKPAPRSGKPDRFYNAKVFVRRSLSEFRDNYLDRSGLLSRTARSLFSTKNNGS